MREAREKTEGSRKRSVRSTQSCMRYHIATSAAALVSQKRKACHIKICPLQLEGQLLIMSRKLDMVTAEYCG